MHTDPQTALGAVIANSWRKRCTQTLKQHLGQW